MCSIKLRMKKKKVSIAVIDSGIDASVSDLSNFLLKTTGYRINQEGYIAEAPDIKPSSLHGTSISLIIRDICKDVQFLSMNILDEKMTTDSRIMIYAMNEAVKLKPDIIHLSLGTTNWRYRSYMKHIVAKATEMNIIIVASYNNNSFWHTYPACIKGVIGVKTSKLLIKKDAYFKKRGCYYAPFSMIDIYGTENLDTNKMRGTSISAAYITGHIANIKRNEGLLNNPEIIKSLDNKI